MVYELYHVNAKVSTTPSAEAAMRVAQDLMDEGEERAKRNGFPSSTSLLEWSKVKSSQDDWNDKYNVFRIRKVRD